MEKSSIIILIASLLLASCGKKNDSGTKSLGIKTPLTAPLTTIDENDFDGDFIENSKDLTPYTAQLPSIEEILIFKRDEQIIRLKSHTNKRVLRNLLTKGFHFKSIEFTPKLDVKLLISPYHTEDLNLEAQRLPGFIDTSFTVSNDKSILTHQNLEEKSIELNTIPKEILKSSSIYASINDSTFKQGEQLTSYKKLLSNISKHSYQLTLIRDEKVENFFISSELNLKEALTEIGKSDVVRKFEDAYKYNSIFNNKIIPNNANLWKILNTKDQKLTQKVSAGKHITIVKYTKTELSRKRALDETIRLNANNQLHKVTLQGAVKVILNLKITRFEKLNESILKNKCINNLKECTYYEHRIFERKTLIKPKDYYKFLQFFVDDKLVSFSEIKNNNFDKSTTHTLSIKMLKEPTRNLKKGFTPGKKCRNGDKVQIDRKKTHIKIRHTIEKNDPSLTIHIIGSSFHFIL
jgi:hypothetical protein